MSVCCLYFRMSLFPKFFWCKRSREEKLVLAAKKKFLRGEKVASLRKCCQLRSEVCHFDGLWQKTIRFAEKFANLQNARVIIGVIWKIRMGRYNLIRQIIDTVILRRLFSQFDGNFDSFFIIFQMVPTKLWICRLFNRKFIFYVKINKMYESDQYGKSGTD